MDIRVATDNTNQTTIPTNGVGFGRAPSIAAVFNSQER
jgi:hypothetical protein